MAMPTKLLSALPVTVGVEARFALKDTDGGGDLSIYTPRAQLWRDPFKKLGGVLTLGDGIALLTGGKYQFTLDATRMAGLIADVNAYVGIELTSSGGTPIEFKLPLTVKRNLV